MRGRKASVRIGVFPHIIGEKNLTGYIGIAILNANNKIGAQIGSLT